VSYLWMDDMPVAVIDGTTLRYIETDHLNTPRALIDPARNVAVWRWDLNGSAFGEHAANEDPDADGTLVKFNLRFPGQYVDAETGLHYNYFRDYEPGTGRYVESDPIGLLGGIAAYSYALQSPNRFVDKRGEAAQALWCLGGPAPCALAAASILACGTLVASEQFPNLEGVPNPPNPDTWKCEKRECEGLPPSAPEPEDGCKTAYTLMNARCSQMTGASFVRCRSAAIAIFTAYVALQAFGE